jgi:hypothetical protein
MLGSRLSIAIVSGAIAPYSNRLYNTLAEAHGLDLHVFTCTGLEPQRKWRIAPATNYTLKVLSGLRYHIDDMRHVYVNPSVLGHLRRLRPSAVILGSFSPTMMAAAAYALATRTPLGISTDGSMSATHLFRARPSGSAPARQASSCSSITDFPQTKVILFR